MTDDDQPIASQSPDPAVDEAILRLVTARGPGKSICPTDAARALNPQTWRPHLSRVRTAAVRLALAGEISILRKGKPVDPTDFRGVYRLALPVGGPPPAS